MAHYRVFIETSAETLEEGGYLAHVPELIGCVARGKTKEAALEKLREAAYAYHALLRRHHLAAPMADEPLDFDVTETEALTLPSDYVPLGEAELDALWERTAILRQSLLDTLNAMPPQALEWKPDAESWAIRNILAHLAQSDLWYASRVEPGGLPELLWRLAAARALVVHRLQELPPHARGEITNHGGEEWTPRKVARRMLEHEQEHLEQIRELLAQISRAQPAGPTEPE